jgi:hypothetical protein
MTAAYVQSVNATVGSATLTGVTLGNKLIAVVGSTFPGETWTFSDTQTNVWTNGLNYTNLGSLQVSYADINASGNVTVTFAESIPGKSNWCTLIEASGIQSGSSLDVTGTNHGLTTMSQTVTSSSSAAGNEFVVAGFQSNATHTWTAGGTSILLSTNGTQFACEYNILNEFAGPISMGTSTTTNATYDAVLACFLPPTVIATPFGPITQFYDVPKLIQ